MTDTPLGDTAVLARKTGRDPTDQSIADALTAATGRFVDAIGYDPRLVTADTVTRNGHGGQTLILPAFPIANVTVTIDGQPVTDIQVDADSGIIRRVAGWPDGLGRIQVTYDHGHATIPDGITAAINEAALIDLTTNPAVQTRALGISSVTFGAAATVGTTQKWADEVAKWRR